MNQSVRQIGANGKGEDQTGPSRSKTKKRKRKPPRQKVTDKQHSRKKAASFLMHASIDNNVCCGCHRIFSSVC